MFFVRVFKYRIEVYMEDWEFYYEDKHVNSFRFCYRLFRMKISVLTEIYSIFRILEFSVISVGLTSLVDKDRNLKPLTYEKMYLEVVDLVETERKWIECNRRIELGN